MTDDLLPAYVAFIRRELQLAPGSDALLELRTRLHPEDASEKPPYRSPAIVRLRGALRRMEGGKLPDVPLEAFAEDLRFLQMFAKDPVVMPEEAMQKLLADVMDSPPIRKTAVTDEPADDKIVPFPGKSSEPRGHQ